jgi:DNA-binding MarR family transcriptional regulator
VIDDGAGEEERDVILEIERGISDLFGAARHVLRVYSAEFHPDLQPTGFSVLRIIFMNAPVQAGVVASLAGLDKSAVSRQIKFLRDLDLVDTQPDPRDGRSSFLVPSALGNERMDAVRRLVRREYEVRLAGWSEADLEAFSGLLDRFNAPAPSSSSS